MKNCSKIHENIFFFDQLISAEQDEIRAHIRICDECRAHFEKVEKIVSGMKQLNRSKHIDHALLVRYVSHLNTPDEPDYDGDKLSADHRGQVENHLKACRVCNEKVSILQKEYAELHSFIEDSKIPDVRIGKLSAIDKVRNYGAKIAGQIKHKADDLLPRGIPGWAPPALAAAALLMIVLLLPGIFRDNSSSLEYPVKLEPVKVRYMMRSGIKPQLEQGFILFNSEHFSEAAKILDSFIEANPDYDNLGYVRYICGLAYLMQCGSDPESGTEMAMNRGIEQLNASLTEDIGLRLQEDVLWYLGKAYLLKKQPDVAETCFRKVQALNGRKAEKSKSILQKIENP